MAGALREEGYSVESASRGEEALALARHEPFDLAVADIRMEGMNGLAGGH
ncbi:MAG: response regulator [Candidatus Eremiobacterota bacterium]